MCFSTSFTSPDHVHPPLRFSQCIASDLISRSSPLLGNILNFSSLHIGHALLTAVPFLSFWRQEWQKFVPQHPVRYASRHGFWHILHSILSGGVSTKSHSYPPLLSILINSRGFPKCIRIIKRAPSAASVGLCVCFQDSSFQDRQGRQSTNSSGIGVQLYAAIT